MKPFCLPLADFLKITLLVGLLTALAGCTSLETTQKQAVAGNDFAMTVKGTAKPTVVLQAGLGDGKDSWSGIISEIAKTHQVVAYDRPGYGGSPANQAPRDPCSIARELRAMLKTANIPPPYILVGHSIGGLYQYAFAKLYPEDVAGLILLDPTHPDHWQRMQQEAPSAAAVLKGVRFTLFSRTARAEFDQQAAGLEAINRRVPLQMPVRHLVRTQYQTVESGAFETMVHSLEKDWSHLLGTSETLRAEGSGHYIHKDRPDLVLAALESLDAEIAKRQAVAPKHP